MKGIECKSICCCKLGVALGLTGAIFTFILGICGWLFGFGVEAIQASASMHPGFAPTFLGSIIGAVWAFVEIFVFVIVAGFIYCKLVKMCNKSDGEEK